MRNQAGLKCISFNVREHFSLEQRRFPRSSCFSSRSKAPGTIFDTLCSISISWQIAFTRIGSFTKIIPCWRSQSLRSRCPLLFTLPVILPELPLIPIWLLGEYSSCFFAFLIFLRSKSSGLPPPGHIRQSIRSRSFCAAAGCSISPTNYLGVIGALSGSSG